MFSWIRAHKYISIGGIIILFVIGGLVVKSRTSYQSTLVTAPVERRDLEQVVSVVGSIDVSQRVKLSARRGGPIVAIPYRVGDAVSAGEVILQVKSTDEQLSLEQARAGLQKVQADLQVKLAGQSPESLSVLAAATEQRAQELQKAQDDHLAATNDQQIIIKTQQQMVADAKKNVQLAAQSALNTASTSINNADAILGVDNITSNETFRSNLSVKDPATLTLAKDQYRSTKGLHAQATSAATGGVDAFATAADVLLKSTSTLLASVSRVLEQSVTGDTLTPATLAAKQSTIATDRTAVNTSQIALETKLQAFHTAPLTQESALQDASAAVTAKQNAQRIAQAAYDSAKATEASNRVAPRAVDIAALQALVGQGRVQVLQAEQAVEDTIVRAPVAGTISDIPVKIGEIVTANQTVAELLGKGQLEVKANIPEVDISKVAVGQKAALTLDAFGSSEKFTATAVTIDPAQTVVEGVATYTVTLQLESDDKRIKPGMTANIDMVTAERTNVLVIPGRALRRTDGKTVVKVQRASVVSEVTVVVGLVGSDGFVEIVSGVGEGESVVVSGE
ncbi:efflux RND transporter periplasmic adaptor subunit [Candidatus Uhrbacteria bacterium]|nr:efflux RND transporter periplasmic adaptor subunit [Candidatus Uhrbacteria bacterium]